MLVCYVCVVDTWRCRLLGTSTAMQSPSMDETALPSAGKHTIVHVSVIGHQCRFFLRFQKIFEEGPPSIASRDVFRSMERAAQRLTRSIGYIGKLIRTCISSVYIYYQYRLHRCWYCGVSIQCCKQQVLFPRT
jgi:hypothetical protein